MPRLSERRIRLYFNENMPEAAATELDSYGIDVRTTQQEKRCGTGDLEQLRFSTSLERVICTMDKDYLELAKTHPVYCGIAFIPPRSHETGAMVKALRNLHRKETADSMRNLPVFL